MNPFSDVSARAGREAVLHLAFSDPRSALRLSDAIAGPLRTALTAQLGARGGQVVEGATGLSAFHSSGADAVKAAIELLANGTALLADESAPVALRAVLVELREGGEAGRAEALSHATQIAAISRDHTLLLTRGLYERLDATLTERSRLALSPAAADHHAGVPGLADLFDLDWRAAALKLALVTVSPEPMEMPQSSDRLELTHGGTQLALAAADCPVTLGRDKSCLLHLDGDVASRIHGRIEFQHDKFYFVDDSRNGTYLLTPQGEEVFLHRERLPLLGKGVISPGAPIVKQTGEVIRYLCRGADSLLPPESASLEPEPVLSP